MTVKIFSWIGILLAACGAMAAELSKEAQGFQEKLGRHNREGDYRAMEEWVFENGAAEEVRRQRAEEAVRVLTDDPSGQVHGDEKEIWAEVFLGRLEKEAGHRWWAFSVGGDLLSELRGSGELVDGKFVRRARGSMSCRARDQARARQCYLKAFQLAKRPEDRAEAGMDLAASFEVGIGAEVFRLSDLSMLPGPERESSRRWFHETDEFLFEGRSPVIGPNGEWRLPELRERFEDARTDGERIYWLLSEVARISPPHAAPAKLKLAGMWNNLLGVRNLAAAGYLYIEGTEEPTPEGQFELATLKDDETILIGAMGPERRTIPAGYRSVTLLRSLVEDPETPEEVWSDATWELMDMFADRYQFDAVEEVARQALARDPDDPDAQEYLERIGPAGEFTDGASFVVGEEAAVEFISRELSEQRFELWRMNVRSCLDEQGNRVLGDSEPWGADAGQFEKYRHYYTRIGDWTAPIRRRGNHLQSTTRVKVPVTEAGNYLVVANVRGRWQVTPLHVARTIVLSAALDGRDGWDDRETWVSGGDADFFLIDALSGRPVEGALVRDAGSGNEAVSDHTGYLLGMGSGGALLVQRPGLTEELLWAEVENIDGLDEDQIRSFLATSQPLYRPGQKVDYAGWLKRPNARGAGKDRLPAGTEVRVRVSDPVGQVIHEVELPLDDFGGFSGSFTLPAEMVLGSCGVELAICHPDPVDPFDEESEVERDWVGVDGDHWGRSWRIEVGEFRKPDFRVDVEAGAEGEGITAEVKASYHSGEAVAGAPVTARLTASPVRYQVFPEQEWDDLYEAGYDWEQPRATWLKGWDSWGIWPEADDWNPDDPYYGDEVVVDATGVTDASGRAVLDFPADLPLLGHREYDCAVKAGVQEFTGRSAGGEAWFVHSGREHEVLIRPELGFYREGDRVKLEAWTLKSDREPVAAAGRVKVESVDAEGGLVEVWSGEVKTSDKGVAEVEFLPPAAGRYRCTFASGGRERGFVLEVIGDEGVAGRSDGLQLIPRKAVASTGDLAEVLVQSGDDESLVWLFEQRADGRRRTPRLVEVRNGSAVVSFPLDSSAMPEMYLQAAAMVKGRLEKATCRIVVPPVDTLLKVDLAADPAKAAPGEKARIAIGVTDAAGKAVPASLAVAAFDQALEDLGGRMAKAGDRMRDRFDGGGYWPASSIEMMERDRWERGAFRELDQPGCFFERSDLTGDPRRRPASRFEKLGTYLGIQYEPPELPNSVGSVDPMAAFPVTPATPSNGLRPAGRVVEMDAGEREKMRKAGVRKNFADRAYWGAALRTDGNGQVRAAFDLPDNLTAWRVQAWAFGKGRAHGDAEVEIQVSKPLQVRPLMPQAAVAGDALEIGAMVQNLSGSRQEFLVTMESGRGESPPARSVLLAAGEEARVVWPVTLTEAGPEVFKLRAVNVDGSLADGAEFILPVAPRSVPVTLAAKSEIAEGATRTRLQLDCPEAAGEATLQVRLEAKAAVGALAVLPDLVGYHHGCTEQTLNRFLPTLVAWQAAGKLGIDWESMQQVFSSGGSSLGWVKGRSALGGRPAELSEEKVRTMIHVGLHRLNELQGPSGAWGWFAAEDAEGSVYMTALAVRGIALARDLGFVLKNDPAKEGAGWLKQWTIRRAAVLAEDPGPAGELDAWVAYVLADSGERETAGLTGVLVKSADRLSKLGLVHLALAIDAQAEPAEFERIMALLAGRMEEAEAGDPTRGDAVEIRAWYLKLLARSGAGVEMLEPRVRDLMMRRTDGVRWSSTKDSALCVEAIIEASIAGGGFPFGDKEVIEAKIDAAREQRTIRLDRSNLWSAFLSIPLEAGMVAGGTLPVTVTRSGTIPMTVAATLAFDSAAPGRMAANDQGIRVDRTFHRIEPGGKRTLLGEGEKLRSGEIVEVVLTIEADRELPYVHLRDPIPAGLEPLIQLSGYESGAYRVSRTGETDFFISSLTDWNRTRSYFLRAVTPGSALALPARAECMYQPEIHGQSAERRIGIAE